VITRYLCDALEDMRKCHKTRNYAQLKGLIEEAQILGNRMESSLEKQNSDHYDEIQHEERRVERRRLKREVRELKLAKARLEGDINELEDRNG